MPRATALIFDLDDTLFAERDFAFSGFRAVAEAFAEQLGLGEPDDVLERMRALYATPARNKLFDALLANTSHAGDEAVINAMVAAYRHHLPAIGFLPDADEALFRLQGTLRLGVISDGFLVTQQNKVTALELSTRVEEIILTDAWGRKFWKPHPRAFAEMSLLFDADPEACVYVADNPAKDFVAPNALGWRTVCVVRDHGVYRDVAPPPGGAPAVTIHSLDELDATLE
jgi:putative hydrolase of the HAD superfamily